MIQSAADEFHFESDQQGSDPTLRDVDVQIGLRTKVPVR
jgi:hypothetical protein